MENFNVAGPFGDDLRHLLALLDAGKLDPQIDRRGPWEGAAKAADALLGRQIEGKAVLDVTRVRS